jgi:hypothetical protein
MRRILLVMAVAAVMMVAMAAPAMAQEWTSCDPDTGLCSTWNPNTGTGGNGLDVEDCGWVWIPEEDDWFFICGV